MGKIFRQAGIISGGRRDFGPADLLDSRCTSVFPRPSISKTGRLCHTLLFPIADIPGRFLDDIEHCRVFNG